MYLLVSFQIKKEDTYFPITLKQNSDNLRWTCGNTTTDRIGDAFNSTMKRQKAESQKKAKPNSQENIQLKIIM